VVRRCVCFRNLKNEEAMTRVGSQRHKKKEMVTVTRISASTSVFPCQCHSTSIPYSSSSTRSCLQRMSGSLPQSNALLTNGEFWVQMYVKYFTLQRVKDCGRFLKDTKLLWSSRIFDFTFKCYLINF
jgi:hypothetical protein